ncbi:MAG: 23S rRNA (uracil(1939)-C(5))-methyltransferase RlmD [Eubacteriales bacterium]|nr:23S rRNA (uracil(1939)-C(5))-methyltransferase RlmD [Eubacteriales bacterium]
MLQKNQLIELNIDSLSSEGSGVGKYEGMAVFVPHTAAGDRIIAKVLKAKKTHAFAKVEEILEASSNRITPECSVSKQCGGCVYCHISYDAELKAKEQRVRDAIERIGGIDTKINGIVGSESENRYRNKAQIPVGISKEGRVQMGFFASHSHRIVECEDCKLQPQEFIAAQKVLKNFIEEHNISVYNEQTHKGLVRHLYLRKGEATRELMICVVINGRQIPHENELVERFITELPNTKTVIVNSNREKTNVVLGKEYRSIFGEGYITDILCGLKFKLSPQSFYQVNRTGAEKLYSIAREYAKLKEDDLLLDMYCGTGTIGLSMAKDCKSLIGVEIVPEAIEDALKNAERNGINNANFVCGDSALAAQKLKSKGMNPDVIILDPPRKGCQRELLETVAEMNPKRVVYVSCDPATLARDLKIFAELGYKTQEVMPVDMFPRTAHVECVVLLTKAHK